MRVTSSVRFALGVPIIATAVLATTAVRTSPSPGPLGAACVATLVDLIPIGANPVDASVKFSESLGDSLSATVADPSGVVVVSIQRGRNDGPSSAVLTLNTMRASAGSWDVNVRSERGECAGRIRVGAVAKAAAAGGASAAKAHAGKKECAVWMNDSIPVGLDRIALTANYAEPIGNNLSAVFPKESGLDVISAKRNPGDDPLSAVLTLNTVRAVAGQWKLELTGDANMCTGMVYVGKKR